MSISQLYYLLTLLAAESAVDWLSSTSKRDFSFRELLPDFKQFLATLVARFRIGHFKTFKRIENNTRNDQPSVLFVIGGNDIPVRVPGARCAEAFFIRLHVPHPEVPLRDIHNAEFPILFRLIDALEETLSLLLLRQVEVEFDDAGSVAVEVSLEIHDGAIPVAPNRLLVERGVGEPFAAENLRMNAGDQHLLIVGPVEDADPAPFRQIAGGAPEKIMLQFGGAGMFEAEYLATLWVDPRHH